MSEWWARSLCARKLSLSHNVGLTVFIAGIGVNVKNCEQVECVYYMVGAGVSCIHRVGLQSKLLLPEVLLETCLSPRSPSEEETPKCGSVAVFDRDCPERRNP